MFSYEFNVKMKSGEYSIVVKKKGFSNYFIEFLANFGKQLLEFEIKRMT